MTPPTANVPRAHQMVPTDQLSVEELERETRLLLEHHAELMSRPSCPRKYCDGKPHNGYPYRHSARRRTQPTPLASAQSLDPHYVDRPHLRYLSDRLAAAVADVEQGRNRYMVVSMPPRSGKSQLTSVHLPLWLLSKHADWSIGLVSHSPDLATSWGRQVRRAVEQVGADLGISIASDAGAVGQWETSNGGVVVSRSAPGQSLTGLGFKVLLMDDLVKDYAGAHSKSSRDALWDWWVANAQSRLEPPFLAVMVGTRWHENDIIGRILSSDYEGDPADWEVIRFPAIATEHDVLGRAPGDPLFSPLLEETREEAVARWDTTRSNAGSYSWASLYQQQPAPSKGSIFDVDWWRFWTVDPDKVTEDGSVVLVDPTQLAHSSRWVDSWDCTFKASTSSDWVVGQRWFRHGPNRYLVAQLRGKWGFTDTLARMEQWADKQRADPYPSSANPWGVHVHEYLVEEAANGSALIEVMRKKVAGIKPVNPRMSKEARARAVTPEIESGNVFLPHPGDPGNGWVRDLLDELRDFPHASHDDQVDALTQALNRLRDAGSGMVTNPATRPIPGSAARVRAAAALDPTLRRAGLRGAGTSTQPGGSLRRVV